jgi:hypothetical protein
MLVTCVRIVWEIGPSLRENMGKNIFEGMMISLIILLRMPSEDSFKGSGSRVDPNLSLSGKEPMTLKENSHRVYAKLYKRTNKYSALLISEEGTPRRRNRIISSIFPKAQSLQLPLAVMRYTT